MKELKLKTKRAVKKTIIRQQLSEGLLNFAFIKKDGSVRVARGTTNLKLIPVDKHPKNNNKSDKVVTFFDLDKNDWRCFSSKTEFVLE